MQIRRFGPHTLRDALLATCALWAASCSTWQVEHEAPGWRLLRQRDARIDSEAWVRSLATAHSAVEDQLGSFGRTVHAHAWTATSPPTDTSADDERSPARVYFHGADTSAAIHELVRVRLAELDSELPLWFQEGLAVYFADGVEVDGAWHLDGLACTPWTELRDIEISDSALARLLHLKATDECSAGDKRLARFLGWALVFDSARREPNRSWSEWRDTLTRAATSVSAARTRLTRTLDPDTVRAWMRRLNGPDPAVRLSTAKGTWRLASAGVIDLLLDALRDERDPQARVTFALNALLAANETTPGWFRWQRLRDEALPALQSATLPDANEHRALRAWCTSFADPTFRPTPDERALAPLARLWRE